MNKQNLILDVEDIVNTYKFRISRNKINILESRKWLPIKEDSEFAQASAYLIGKIMGDGNLDSKFTSRFIGQEKDLIRLQEYIIQKFSIRKDAFKIRFRMYWGGTSYLLQVNDSSLGRLLYTLGAPIGNKVKTNFLIPDWIIASENAKKDFLKSIFDDELSTIKIKRGIYVREATFRMAKG